MFENNIIPTNEMGKHAPYLMCLCNPKVKRWNGRKYLYHFAFDHQEIWMAVERELGIICYEHMEFVDDTYQQGRTHAHYPRPELQFEYNHTKIDPRIN